MSDIQKYLLTVDKDKEAALTVAQDTARKLESKRITLIDVVQSLGEYINDEDFTIRAKAVTYLAHVITTLGPEVLTRQQVQVLCQFLCDRIEDGGAIVGLRKLQGLSRFNKPMAVMAFRAMLEHFQDLQIRPQAQRLQILELLNDLMSLHRAALKEMGDESIVGVIDLVSGEKDPRNLMIIFSILKVVMIEWDISRHAEVLFDAVFCYFPITFRPPPDDPYGITAQDLKGRLRDCVAASRDFAPFAFPQLIDKLDSTSPSVKKDVIYTITACASSYGVSVLSNYAIMLWDSLKYEILNVQEEDLADESLVALQVIATKLSEGLTSRDPKTPLAKYIRSITKECNEQLKEPQHKQAKPAGQVLSSLGKASPTALFLMIKGVVPSVLTLYQDAESISKQRALLEVLVKILDSAIEISTASSVDSPTSDTLDPLEPFKNRLLELTSQGLMSTTAEEVSFRIVALRGLLRLCLLPKYLQDNEIGMVVQHLDEIILSEDSHGRDDLKDEAIQALVHISRIKANLVMDITIPAFMARLPDSSSSENADYIITLEGLAQLSVEKSTSDTLIRRLLNRLDVVLQSSGSFAYPQAILSALHYILSKKDLAHDPELGSYYEKIVVRLVRRAVLASTGENSSPALTDESILGTLGRLVNRIVRVLDEDKQKSVGYQIYSLFAAETSFMPVPYRENVSKLQRSTLILSTYLMAAVGGGASLDSIFVFALTDRVQIFVPYTEDDGTKTQSLLKELVRLALVEDIPAIRQSILRQLALFTNKFLKPTNIHFATDMLFELSAKSLEIRDSLENTIRAMFWIAKGLVLRLADTNAVLECLLDVLPNTNCGLPSARGFDLLLAPDEMLSKENGATMRLLSKQKVFNICIPRIAKDFQHAETSIKPNYLIALSGILKYMPTEVLMPEIDTLLPLLLQSLDLRDAGVKAATIESLTVVGTESPKAVEGHISSLVSRLLRSTAERKTNSPKVRHSALRCLRMFPGKIKDSALLPYKKAVTRGLTAALDDPKRNVRKEAVDCRAAWLNMDEPEEED